MSFDFSRGGGADNDNAQRRSRPERGGGGIVGATVLHFTSTFLAHLLALVVFALILKWYVVSEIREAATELREGINDRLKKDPPPFKVPQWGKE